MMKKVVGIFVMSLILATTSAFADHHAGAVGEWDMTLDFQGQEVPGTLSIEMDGDALKGTWTGQGNTSELTNLEYAEDGALTFNRSVEFGGQTYDLSFTGKIEGDSVTGEFDTPMGALAVEGSRPGGGGEAPAEEGGSGGADALLGSWETTTVSELGTLEATMEFTVAISGTYIGDGAEFEMTDIALDGDKVTFKMVAEMDGTELPLTFEGKIDGTSLTGEFISDLGNGQVTATKVGGAAGGDEGAIRGIIDTVLSALKEQDIEAMTAPYADDFTSDQGGGKAEMVEFLQGAKDQGFLEDIAINTDDLEIEIDGDKAAAEPIELEGAFGVLTLSFELEKRDGAWVVTYQAQY